MAITIELRDEACGRLRAADEVLQWRDLPDSSDFPNLGRIDPVGDTMFNRPQMDVVIPEILRIIRDRPSPTWDKVLELARECAAGVHTYLWFIGD